MVSLQPQWSGSVVAIAAGARARWTNLDVIQDLLPVVIDRQPLLHKRNIEGLPLSGRLARIRCRRNPAVEGRTPALAGRLAVAVCDLNFVAIAQVHARVASRNDLEFHVELKIVEVLVGLKVGPLGCGRISAVLDFPQIWPVGFAQMPSSEVLPVEERNPAGPTR